MYRLMVCRSYGDHPGGGFGGRGRLRVDVQGPRRHAPRLGPGRDPPSYSPKHRRICGGGGGGDVDDADDDDDDYFDTAHAPLVDVQGAAVNFSCPRAGMLIHLDVVETLPDGRDGRDQHHDHDHP
jgi:hypothetical protein